MGNVLGSANTLTGGADYKEKANQNKAKQRRGAMAQPADTSFQMPGAQQMQAQQQAQQAKRFQGQPMTFANMQQQGVARPAPPQPPAVQPQQQAGAQRFRGPMMNNVVPAVQQALQQQPAVQPNPALQQQVAGAMQQGQMQPQQPMQPQLAQQVQQQMQQPAPQQPMQQSAVGGDLQQRLIQQLTQLSETPSAYQTEDIQQMREAQRSDIEAEFGAQRQALEEDLARRGLSASSIAAGRFGDLAGQQARAMATAEAGLTEKAAESLQRGREAAIQGLAQAAGVELEAKGLDLQSKKVQADIDAEAKRLMQQDRSLDLQQARDQAQNQIARAQLVEQAKARVSRENISMAELNQNAAQFADRLGLDTERFIADRDARAREIALSEEGLDLRAATAAAEQELQRAILEQQVINNERNYDLAAQNQEIQRLLAELSLMSGLSQYAQQPPPASTPQPGPVYNPTPPVNAGGGGGGYPGGTPGQGGFE